MPGVEILKIMKVADNRCAGLRIFLAEEPSSAILNFAKIAACAGIESRFANLAHGTSTPEELRSAALAGASVWDIDSLSAIIPGGAWSSLADLLSEGSASVLLLVRSSSASSDDILKTLTKGRVIGADSAGHPEAVRFPATGGAWSEQLSGFGYGRSGKETLALQTAGDSGLDNIMDHGGDSPAFAVLASGSSRLYIWSTLSVFDMDQPLARELEFEQAADEYIPAIIFLRHAFGDQCWSSPDMGADIVIDDPILEKRYGCIDFSRLLQLATELHFHITVAFIPWNHWRTRSEKLQLFLSYKESFDICAHGCDHVSREFRSKNYAELLARSHLAAERLDRHRDRTGMTWDRFMVVPREEYSVEAMRALADSGRYLGMANTGCIPRDMDANAVRGSDLLLPVQDAFFGFPIFKRHYWSNMSPFGMSAFLGKPAILCEHHAFFQDDCTRLEQFVVQLNALYPGVRWSGLSALARRVHQRKRATTGGWDIRFFTDEFEVGNQEDAERLYRFERRLPPEVGVRNISINGNEVSFSRDGSRVCFESYLKAGEVARIQVDRTITSPPQPVSLKWTYQAGVATRRLLSEMRDQAGCKSAK